VRLCHDDVRSQMALLHPEGVALLNATAGAAGPGGVWSPVAGTQAKLHR
jgi:hypothetical protein